MEMLGRAVLVALGLTAAVCSTQAQPIAWSAGEGGNGHFYERVATVDGINWTDARDVATQSYYGGRRGHLLTVNSEDEWQFILTHFREKFTWIGLTDAEVEGTFRWVTGEPFEYRVWLPGEPNNAGDEDYVWYEVRDDFWGWNDYRNDTHARTGLEDFPMAYLVEYEWADGSCKGDFNDDGAVDSRDFIAFLNAWANGDARADYDDDGSVDTADFLLFLNEWATGC